MDDKEIFSSILKLKVESDIDVGPIDDVSIDEARRKSEKMFYIVGVNMGAKIINFSKLTEHTNNQLVAMTNIMRFYTVMHMGKYVSPDWINGNASQPLEKLDSTSGPTDKKY